MPRAFRVEPTVPLGNGLSKTYIACTNPVYQPALRTHEWVKRQSDWQYLELATGHAAVVISPKELAVTLVDCPSA